MLMKSTFKMGDVNVSVKVADEADVNVSINGIETSFEGTGEEVVAMYKEMAVMIKETVAAQMAGSCECGTCDC